MTRAGGLGDEPRRIFEELGKISLVDVVFPTREKKVEIRRRCVARPTDHQAILLDHSCMNRQFTAYGVHGRPRVFRKSGPVGYCFARRSIMARHSRSNRRSGLGVSPWPCWRGTPNAGTAGRNGVPRLGVIPGDGSRTPTKRSGGRPESKNVSIRATAFCGSALGSSGSVASSSWYRLSAAARSSPNRWRTPRIVTQNSPFLFPPPEFTRLGHANLPCQSDVLSVY